MATRPFRLDYRSWEALLRVDVKRETIFSVRVTFQSFEEYLAGHGILGTSFRIARHMLLVPCKSARFA